MRAGRKRKSGARRKGRLVQPINSQRRDDVTKVAKEARERVFGLSPSEARTMPESSALGRLAATGEISLPQFEAGSRYAAIVREHDTMLGARAFPKAGDLNRARGHDGEGDDSAAYHARYRAAMARYDRCRAALRGAAGEDRMASIVVDAVAVYDRSLPDVTPALRIGLNHLIRSGAVLP